MSETAVTVCPGCFGEHEPDPADAYVDFRGRRFRPPFPCLCCGKPTCARQFAWGRTCGFCDAGGCHSSGIHFGRQHGRRDILEAAELNLKGITGEES